MGWGTSVSLFQCSKLCSAAYVCRARAPPRASLGTHTVLHYGFQFSKPLLCVCPRTPHALPRTEIAPQILFICWNNSSQYDGIWIWVLWKTVLGEVMREGLREEISALTGRDIRELALSLYHVRRRLKMITCKPGRELSPHPDQAGTISSDFQAPVG